MFFTKKKISSLLTILISLALITFLYPKLQHPALFQTYLAGLGWKGILLVLLIVSLQMLFPIIPFPLLAGLNIVLFGWILGFTLSLSGSLIGSSLGFWLARFLGQEWIHAKLANSDKLGQWANLSPEKTFYLIILTRLTPIFPAALVNYAVGLSPVKFQLFFVASLLGKIPMIAWESWIGHDFWQLSHHPKRFAGALILGALIFGGLWLSYRISEVRSQRPDVR
ncbi:MAG: VTT domain-containing protein [Desulfitobacteriaceae bacterium]